MACNALQAQSGYSSWPGVRRRTEMLTFHKLWHPYLFVLIHFGSSVSMPAHSVRIYYTSYSTVLLRREFRVG